MLLAIKYAEDFYYDNEFYSKVGGLSLKELNDLEGEMLDMIGFFLHVDESVYKKYKEDIEQYMKNRIYKTLSPDKEEEKTPVHMIVSSESGPP